MELDFC
jgi:hypothetical protein